MIKIINNEILDTDIFSEEYHLCYYLPVNKFTQDEHSKKILEFKNNRDENIILKWRKWVIDEFKDNDIKFDYIVRALGHKELSISHKKKLEEITEQDREWLIPLDYIGYSLQKRVGGEYIPHAIVKTKMIEKLAPLKLLARAEQLKGAYNVGDDCPDLNNKTVLIIDDITTSKVTAKAIAHAIKKKYPKASFILFTLAKTIDLVSANNDITKEYFEDSK